MQDLSKLLEPRSVRGELNFAANDKDGGIWCNYDRSKITQELLGRPVQLHNARALDTPPSLDREGFELHHAPVPAKPGRWADPQWVAEVYLPHCVDLVQRATGAPRVIPFQPHAVVRDTGDQNAVPAAEFIHLDVSRELGFEMLRKKLGEDDFKKLRRFKTINIWRALTPPPQDVPLALCDQRTMSEKDWVYGRTIQDGFPDGAPYVTSTYNEAQKWYYFPDLNIDQAIIFKNFDSDENEPLGCLHGAFRYPDVAPGSIPRASVEARVYALY